MVNVLRLVIKFILPFQMVNMNIYKELLWLLPVVAGASAVLLAYMPNLKPEQVIESLMKSVNKSEVNAMLPTNTNNRFDLISESGGVIDLYKAAQYAYTHFYKAAPAKPVKKR